MGYTDMHLQNTVSDPCLPLKVLQSRFISCHVILVKSILGSVDCICPLSVTLGLRSSDGSWRVPWLTLTERCPLPFGSAPPSASPRLLLASSGHLIKGLVGLMVVSVSPHAGYYY